MIFGAQGSIGQCLVGHFHSKGTKVIAVSSSEINKTHRTDVLWESLSKRETSLNRLFAKHEVDLCINAAGSPTVGFSFENVNEDEYLNFQLPKLIMDAILESRPDCKLINFSSAAVYGAPSVLPISEDFAPEPISPYGKHKLQAEEYLSHSASKGLQCVSFRIFSAYGIPFKKQLLWDLAKKCASDEQVLLFGNGKESRDFIHVEDIVKICSEYYMKGKFDGSVVNICSGIETTIETVAQLFLKEYGRAQSDLNFNMEIRKGDPRNWRGDTTRLFESVDFTPAPIEEGIKSYIKWFKSL